MARKLLERRLADTGQRLKQLRADFQVAEEQFSHFSEEAADARIRSLVSETPLAGQEHRQANKHAETIFGRHEPCLTYRHKLFAKLAELGRIEMRKTAKTPKKVAIASRL